MTSTTKPIRILYMEDDSGLARLFQKKLERAGYVVDIARDGREGLDMYSAASYDVVATDQTMPVHNGLEVIRILASQGPLPPTIMVTGTGSEQTAVEAMKLGASDYIVKDVDGGYLDLLLTVIERVLRQQRLLEDKQRAEEALRRRAEELEALAQVSSALRAAQTVDEILSIVLEQTTQSVVPATAGSIFLADPESNDLVLQATHPPDFYPLGKRHHLGTGIIGHVAATGETYISQDLANDPLACAQPDQTQHLNAIGGCIALALYTKERSIGVMNIMWYERRPFAAEKVQLLTATADIAANALHRALVVEGLEAEVSARTAEIRAEREKSETILRSVGDAIAMTNMERQIQYVNQAFTTLTGYTADEVLGQRVESLIEKRVAGKEMSERVQQFFQLALNQEGTLQTEVTIRRKDGRLYDAALTVAPMYDAAGTLVGHVSSHQDISQAKELERARNQFIANVSHELRTPATILQTALYLLQKAKHPEKAQLYFQMMQEEMARLIHLIEDILEIATLDSGQATFAWTSVSLSAIVENVVKYYQARAQASGLKLVALPSPRDLRAKGDPDRLAQALGEIVENAINFTPTDGQVTVYATQEKDGAEMSIAVRNTGPGLSPEEQKKVFERFFRGSLAEMGSIPGTGLGLSIAQEIMRAHGGRVTVESTPGKGSTFKMWLLPE